MFVTDLFRGKCFAAALIGLVLLIAGCGSDSTDGSDRAADSGRDAGARSSSRQTIGEDDGLQRSVDSETLAYAEVDDELVYGYFAFPSDMIKPLPAIIVIHDWWGLNDDMRNTANRLAAEGYIVLAVDLYGREVAEDIQSARAKMIAVVESPGAVESNLRQALDFVGIAGAPTKAMMGWGLGGAWSLNATMLYPDELNAAVIYYGQVSDDEDRLRSINAPILGLFGARDRGITVETVRRFETAMQRLRKDLTLEIYDNVGHAFADPARGSYNADVSDTAWRRSIDFLGRNLEPTDES